MISLDVRNILHSLGVIRYGPPYLVGERDDTVYDLQQDTEPSVGFTPGFREQLRIIRWHLEDLIELSQVRESWWREARIVAREQVYQLLDPPPVVVKHLITIAYLEYVGDGLHLPLATYYILSTPSLRASFECLYAHLMYQDPFLESTYNYYQRKARRRQRMQKMREELASELLKDLGVDRFFRGSSK